MDQMPLYLDYAATTPVDPQVSAAMIPWLSDRFGNAASSGHAWGQQAAQAVHQAREQVAALIGAEARDIIWTSGATESINLAIKGVSAGASQKDKKPHLITLNTEHKAVLDTMHELESQGLCDVSYLGVEPSGLVDLAKLEAALRPETILVSILLVNNEIGVIQDIAAIGALCRERGVLLHVDAAQATGRVVIDVKTMPIDLMSMTAHKTYGPKGIGALYVRRTPKLRLSAQIHGGGQERGMRSGTLATHQIVGMGACFALAAQRMEQDQAHALGLQQELLRRLSAELEKEAIAINGTLEAGRRIAHNLSISVKGVQGEALATALQDKIAVSSGSACTSASAEPSHVLVALGRSPELAASTIRLSFGRFTTETQLDYAAQVLIQAIRKLRSISPVATPFENGPHEYSAQVGSLESGQILALQARLDPFTKVILRVHSRTYGCPWMISTVAWLEQYLRGRSTEQMREEWKRLQDGGFVSLACKAVELPAQKIQCALTAQEAVEALLGALP